MPSQVKQDKGKKTNAKNESGDNSESPEVTPASTTTKKAKAGQYKSRLFKKSYIQPIIKWLKNRAIYQRFVTIEDIRDKQFDEERAQKDYEFSRPPKGVELHLRSIRLIELFQIEELERLQRGILDLFPRIEYDLNVKPTIQSLLKDASDIFMTAAHWRIGFVARSKLFIGMPFREMATLPEEVSHINVEVIKFTASSFALCLDVHMTDKATQRVVELQSQQYLPKIHFITRLKWILLRKGFEKHSSVVMRRQATLKQLMLWQSELERLFAKYFKGYFYSQPRLHGESILPAIEVFIFNGAPAKEEELSKWIEDSRGWWDSLGFDFFFAAFKSRTMIFVWATINSWFRSVPHRLVFFPEAYKYSRHESLHDEIHINFQFEEDLNNLTPLIIIWHYIHVVRKRVSNLKRATLKEMQFRWWSWFWPHMRPLIRLNSQIQQESMFMDRLSFEWGERVKEITESKGRQSNMMSLLAYRSVLGTEEDERENLRDAPLKLIGGLIESLNKQLSHLRTWYAEYLVSRNAWVTYGLTLVVGLATIVGLISIRKEIVIVWQSLSRFIKQLVQI